VHSLHIRRGVRDGLAVACAGLLALIGSACYGPDNLTSLGFGDYLTEDAQFVQFEASSDDLSGTMLDYSRAYLFASNGLPVVVLGGEATIDKGDDGLVSLVWVFQEPNQVKRKEKKIDVKQDADVGFFLLWYQNIDGFDTQSPFCESEPILLDSCKGKGKVKEDGPAGKMKVKCKDVDASAAATAFLDVDQGDFTCEEGSFTQEQLTAFIDMFLDNGKLKIQIKDDNGEILDEGGAPLALQL
jgi:hypothetical protein